MLVQLSLISKVSISLIISGYNNLLLQGVVCYYKNRRLAREMDLPGGSQVETCGPSFCREAAVCCFYGGIFIVS